MALWSEWWVWLSGAVLLATLEVIVPGYVFLGFAIGAALVGALLLLGLLPGGLALAVEGALGAGGLPLLLLIFALLSGVSFLLLRRSLGVRKGQVKIWERDIND